MTYLDRILGTIGVLYLRISQLLLLMLVLGILAEVILRYFLGRGILGSAELTRMAVTWIVFLMSFVLYRSHKHIVVSALVDTLSPRARRACDMVVNAAVIVLSVYVLVQLQAVWEFLGLKTPVFRIPDTAFKLAPAFCFIPMAGQALLNLLRPR